MTSTGDLDGCSAAETSWTIGEAMAPSPSDESSEDEEEDQESTEKEVANINAKQEFVNERGIEFRAPHPKNDGIIDVTPRNRKLIFMHVFSL